MAIPPKHKCSGILAIRFYERDRIKNNLSIFDKYFNTKKYQRALDKIRRLKYIEDELWGNRVFIEHKKGDQGIRYGEDKIH